MTKNRLYCGDNLEILRNREVTRGFAEDIALRERYEKEGFGLETVFERQEWAEGRVAELKRTYGLSDADIRLVKHISTAETGEKATWEVYVKAGKGLPVLSLLHRRDLLEKRRKFGSSRLFSSTFRRRRNRKKNSKPFAVLVSTC